MEVDGEGDGEADDGSDLEDELEDQLAESGDEDLGDTESGDEDLGGTDDGVLFQNCVGLFTMFTVLSSELSVLLPIGRIWGIND